MQWYGCDFTNSGTYRFAAIGSNIPDIVERMERVTHVRIDALILLERSLCKLCDLEQTRETRRQQRRDWSKHRQSRHVKGQAQRTCSRECLKKRE